MTRTVMVRNLVAVAAITLVSVGLSGCDYWPPALKHKSNNSVPSSRVQQWKRHSYRINLLPLRR